MATLSNIYQPTENRKLDLIRRKPLKILFVSHDAHPMGAQNLLLTLTSWLKENELAVPKFLLAGPGPLTEEFIRTGPSLIWETERQSNSTAEAIVRLLRSFCGNDLDAVYLNSAASGHIIEATRCLGVPQIVHVHELEKSIERWVGMEKMSALRQHAQTFITASAPVADNLHQRHEIPRHKLHVVDAFIKCTGIRDVSDSEKQQCKSGLGLDPQAKLVLGCGTMDWRKAPDLFVEVAIATCKFYSGSVQFVWVGRESQSGDITRLEQLANSAGIGGQIKFIREVPTPLPFMIAADVFLLSSREDPFPLVCLEAADCGVPTVCFAEAGGMPAFVGSSCGTVVSGFDVQQMAEELSSLLNDKVRLRQLGEQARAKVRAHFDVSIKGREIHEILQKVCEVPELRSLEAKQV